MRCILLTIVMRLHQWSDHHGDQCPTPNNTHVANRYGYFTPVFHSSWLVSYDMCTGFDKLMPEHRRFPYKYLPKVGIQLGVTFGDPIPPDEIAIALDAALRRQKRASSPAGIVGNPTRRSEPPTRPGLCDAPCASGWMADAIVQAGGDALVEREVAEQLVQMDEIRSEVTAIIQRAVEDLGRKVSGNTLGRPLPHRIGESGDRPAH